MAKRQEQGPDGPVGMQPPPVLTILIEFNQVDGALKVTGNIILNKIVAGGMLTNALHQVVGGPPPQRDVGLQIVRGGLGVAGGRAN